MGPNNQKQGDVICDGKLQLFLLTRPDGTEVSGVLAIFRRMETPEVTRELQNSNDMNAHSQRGLTLGPTVAFCTPISGIDPEG